MSIYSWRACLEIALCKSLELLMKLLDIHLRCARAIIAELGVAETVNCLLELRLLISFCIALSAYNPFVLVPASSENQSKYFFLVIAS